jgi:hypothetical protein
MGREGIHGHGALLNILQTRSLCKCVARTMCRSSSKDYPPLEHARQPQSRTKSPQYMQNQSTPPTKRTSRHVAPTCKSDGPRDCNASHSSRLAKSIPHVIAPCTAHAIQKECVLVGHMKFAANINWLGWAGKVQSNPVQFNPVQSSPIQSGEVQSSPVQSSPIQSNPVPPVQSSPVQFRRSSPIQFRRTARRVLKGRQATTVYDRSDDRVLWLPQWPRYRKGVTGSHSGRGDDRVLWRAPPQSVHSTWSVSRVLWRAPPGPQRPPSLSPRTRPSRPSPSTSSRPWR